MPIPNATNAIIEPAKLRDYLLSPSHAIGRYKAVVFGVMGYRQDSWQLLEADLRQQHLSLDPSRSSTHQFGRIYEILAEMTGPSGKIVSVQSVWIILDGEDCPRFVTAYPGKTL